MSGGVKASLVIGGLIAFFLVPVVGPGLEGAMGTMIQFALGSDDQTAAANRKIRGDARYAAGGPLKKSLACCQTCGLKWDFLSDRCVSTNQTDNHCYMTCSPKP